MTLPWRSPGVLLSALSDDAVAYDLILGVAHHLNPGAAALLAACDGTTGRDDAIDAWADGAGLARTVVAAEVDGALATLGALGLVGRPTVFVPPEPPGGSNAAPSDGDRCGAVHPVIDWRVRFRGPDPELLDVIDLHLGTGVDGGAADGETIGRLDGASLVIDVREEFSGEVVLTADHELRFPHRRSLLDHLTMVLSDYSMATHTCAALHAGGVRSPAGDVWLLPAPSGAGKSTLTAAFVALGWDYLGDDIVGVRADPLVAIGYPKRLAVDRTSRVALGLPGSDDRDLDPFRLRRDVVRLSGELEPITQVVLPTFVEGADFTLERLEPRTAVDALLANTPNLTRAGQPALDAVCALAATVPVQRLTHGDALQAAARLIATVSLSGR